MDSNLFEELEEMGGVHKSNLGEKRRPPLLSFDSVDSVGGEAERFVKITFYLHVPNIKELMFS